LKAVRDGIGGGVVGVLLAREAFLLGGGDNLAVDHKGRCTIVVESRDSEDCSHGWRGVSMVKSQFVPPILRLPSAKRHPEPFRPPYLRLPGAKGQQELCRTPGLRGGPEFRGFSQAAKEA